VQKRSALAVQDIGKRRFDRGRIGDIHGLMHGMVTAKGTAVQKPARACNSAPCKIYSRKGFHPGEAL
jgi:hypothetical protein